MRLPVGLLVRLAGEAAGLAFGLAFGKVWRSGGRKVWLTKPVGKVGGKDDPSDPAGDSFR